MESEKKEGLLKVITVNLPDSYIEAIQILIDYNIYPSRSEAIRSGLEDFLIKEAQFSEDLENLEIILEGG